MSEGRGVYRVLGGKPGEREQWGHPGVDVRILLRWISKKWVVGVWFGLSWLRIGTGGGHLTNVVMNFRVPQNVGNFLTRCKLVSFSRKTLLPGISK
jgi:hypothetical protein